VIKTKTVSVVNPALHSARRISVDRVIVADPDDGWRDLLGQSLCRSGLDVTLVANIETLRAAVSEIRPQLVISEVAFADGSWLDVIDLLSETQTPVVIVTSRGAIASAVRAIQKGALNYLVKPVTGEQLLAALDADTTGMEDAQPMTLDRAVYEYLVQTVDATGSLAGAARNLGLDRRSLRRMLAKNPPQK
jgi:two-component system, response regulator RegA